MIKELSVISYTMIDYMKQKILFLFSQEDN